METKAELCTPSVNYEAICENVDIVLVCAYVSFSTATYS